jgi:hypothetical protein
MSRHLLSLLLVSMLFVAACNSVPLPQPPIAAAAAQPTLTPADSFPPLVVATVPERGVEQPLDAPIELTFDQPMDHASVEKAFALEPGASVDGAFTWVDDRTVQFALKDGFRRGERYRVRVVETAESAAGLPLNRPFEMNFSAVGLLTVTNVQPAAGATEVALDSRVIVMFSRPVVPLGALEQAATLPDPLTFTPPVAGQGEWLNTATYQFAPAANLTPATTYTARVAKGLTDVTGSALLEDDFTWQFTTVSPAVVASLPAPGDVYVSPTPVISVAFNQLMDRAGIEENLLVIDDATGASVPGQFRWVDGGLTPPVQLDPNVYYETPPPPPEPVGVETVAFTPTAPLQPGGSYQLMLPKGVLSDQGAPATADYSAGFTVSPLPELASSLPADGEQFADIWQGLELTFNAPMDPASVVLGQSLVIKPEVAATDVYTYWTNSETQLSVNFPRRENSAYTVTLTTDVLSRYGQPLAQPEVIRWQTLRASPYVYLVSPKVGVYNGYQPETYVYMTVRNVSQVDFELYRLSPADFMRLSPQSYGGFQPGFEWDHFTPSSVDLIGAWQQSVAPVEFENYVYKVDVSQAVNQGQPLPPGLYYLTAAAPPDSFYPETAGADTSTAIDRQILIVSKRNLMVKQGSGEVLAWVTDLESGRPVAKTPLTFFDPTGQTQQAETATDGAAAFSYPVTPDTQYANLFVVAGDPDSPGNGFAVGSNLWNAGIQPYDFSYLFENGDFTYSRRYTGHLYPERPLYRPGQTVYFKGIARVDDDARYTISTALPVTVNIYDPQYRQVFSATLPLDQYGTFNGSLVLDDEASLGGYSLEATILDPVWGQMSLGYTSFAVAEYKKPEFLVNVTTDQAEYRAGETVNLTAAAAFFAGGPVANATVRWTLLADPYYFNYQGEGYYSFFNEADIHSTDFNPNYGYGFGQQIANGEGVTDSAGRFTMAIPADLTGYLTSQTFTFDVAVTGLNNQEVAAQARAVVHKGEVYVGVRPLSNVGRIGEANQVEALVVDWASKPVAKQPVDIAVTRQDWYSTQQLDPAAVSADPQYYWTNQVTDVAVFSTTVTTGADGKAVAAFTPTDGGSYKVVARAIDSHRQEVFASTFIWATGYQYVNWGQEDNDRLELIADQPEYNSGDIAKILVPHPYSGTVTALVTLERSHVYTHFVTSLATNSDQLEIPVTADLAPNIYVSAMIVQGMTDASGVLPTGEVQPGLPTFKMGYARLVVNPAEKLLTVSITPGPPVGEVPYYAPGEAVEYQVKVTDYLGRPVQAELSLALIDKAVLTLAPEPPGRLQQAFWQRRALEVNTGNSLTLALDRINRALDERKGGGGGDGALGPDSVRQNFADTALWEATFTTAATGIGTITADLPDNLTTWVLLAKGVTKNDTLVGETRIELVTSKPLLVRPVTPRFMVVGDSLWVGQVIQNNTTVPVTVTPRFTATGLEIGQWRIAAGDWRPFGQPATVKIDPGAEVKVEYQAIVQAADEAQLTMGARAATGQLSDAIAFSLPIYHLSTPETVATLGQISGSGIRTEGIVLPAQFDPTTGGLDISLEPSLAAGLVNGLSYLEHFPYECVEQTVSRFLPNIFTARAAADLKLNQPELQKNLAKQVNIGVQRLYSQQAVDGGWGWWPGDGSDPNLTAYVLLGLVEARRADFPVEQYVIDNAVAFLQGSLLAPKDIAAPWQANQQAFVLYVLAEAGQSDMSRMVTLFEQREQLDNFGRAFLALGLHLADPAAGQIDTLVSDVTNAVVVSATGAHWEETAPDARAMNTDVRSTAIIVAAFSRIQPDHALLPPAVRWLMTVRQQGGYWSTTQETAWSIIGLTDWLAASGELDAAYAWSTSLNGAELDSGKVTPANLTDTTALHLAIGDLLTEAVNRLAVERDGEAGQLYYAAYLTYAKPADTVKALDNGLSVQRQYRRMGGDGKAITSANVGDYVQVELTLIAPTDLHYVLVEDYLPAGAEALDSSLATTSLTAAAPAPGQSDSRQPWGWGYFTHTDLRDEKAVLFANYLPAGVYQYTYTIRASLPGEYRVIPTHAEQMYFPEVFGRSDGALFEITQ